MQSAPKPEESIDTNWTEDVLDRRRYADFLTRHIARRVEVDKQPVTMALDAPWGAGKTFFVEKWAAELNSRGAGVISFDAWKHDIAADPLLSFMSEITAGLRSITRERMSGPDQITSAAKDKVTGMVKSFTKAFVPALATAGKQLLLKTMGLGWDEIAEAFEKGKPSLSEEDLKRLTQDAVDSAKQGASVFVETAMEEHQDRVKAVQAFRVKLAELVEQMRTEKIVTGPLYVFVDELDRCRPDFALRLLEGIKHLFAVPGVVFVLSTNVEQLSESVKVVYGAGFNGRTYLKRFFDFEFHLPAPNNFQFAQFLHVQQPFASGRTIHPGLDLRCYPNQDPVPLVFQLMADAMQLTLRDQGQVWQAASAAADGLPPDRTIHALWLFFLTALRHVDRSSFEQLRRPKDANTLQTIVTRAFVAGVPPVKYMRRMQKGNYGQALEEDELSIALVLLTYDEALGMTRSALTEKYQEHHSPSYPTTLWNVLMQEPPLPCRGNPDSLALASYHDMVAMASQLDP